MEELEGLGATPIVTEIIVKARETAHEVLEAVMSELEKLAAAGDSMTARAEVWGRALGAFTLGMGGAAAAVIAWGARSAEHFQHVMDTIESFAQGSDRYMEEYKQGVLSIADLTGDSSDNIAAALQRVVEANYRGAAAIDITTQAEKAAVGAHQSVQAVLNPLISVMRTWNLTAEQARHVMDAVIVGARNAGGEFSVLNRTLSIASTSAKAVGVSYQDLIALTDELSAGGTKVYQSGRQVYGFLQDLQRQLVVTNPEARRLGVTYEELQHKGETGLMPMLKALDEAFQSQTKSGESYTQSVHDLLGTGPAFDAYMQLQENHFKSLKGFVDQQSDSLKGAGATQESFDAASKSLSYTMEQFQTRLDTLATAIGTAFIPALSDMTSHISAVLVPMEQFFYAHQELTKVTLGTIAVMGGLLGAIKLTQSIIGPFVTAYLTLTGAESAEALAIKAHTAAIAENTAALRGEVAAVSEQTASLETQAPVWKEIRDLELSTAATEKEMTALCDQVTVSINEQTAAMERQAVVQAELQRDGTAMLLGVDGKKLSTQAVTAATVEGTVATEAATTAAVAETGVMASLGAALDSVGAAMLAIVGLPGLIAIGVMALGAAFIYAYNHNSDFHKRVGETRDYLKNVLDGTIIETTKLVNALGDAFGYAGGQGQKFGNWSDHHSGGRSNAVADWFGDRFGGIGNDIGSAAKNAGINPTWDKATQGLSQMNIANSIGPFGALVTTAGKADMDYLNATAEQTKQQEKLNSMTFANDAQRLGMLAKMREAMQEQAKIAQDTANREKDARAEAERLLKNNGELEAQRRKALDFSRGGGQAESGLLASLNQFPSQLRGVLQPQIDLWNRAISKANQDYQTSVTKANNDMYLQQAKIIGDFVSQSKSIEDGQRKGWQDQLIALQKHTAEALRQLSRVHNENIQNLQRTLSNNVQNVRDAMKQIGTSPGKMEQQLTSASADKAALAVSAVAAELLKGSGGLAEFTEKAVHAAQIADIFAEANRKAAIIVDQKTGQFAAALSLVTQKLNDELANAEAKYATDLLNHTGNLGKDADAIRQSATASNKASDAQARAAAIAASVVQSFTSLQQAADKTAQDALGKLALQIERTGTYTDKQAQSAITTAEKSQKFADALTKAQEIVAKASQSFFSLQQAADKTSQDALGKLAMSLYRTGTYTDAQAQSAINAADKSKRFADALTKAQEVVARASKSFSDLQSVADKTAQTTLEKLALAFMSGASNLGTLERAAVLAAERSKEFAAALDWAKKHVDPTVKTDADKLSAGTQRAQDELNNALAHGARDILHHGQMTEYDIEAIRGATANLKVFTDATAKAAKAQQGPGNFDTQMQDAQNGFSLAMRHLSEGVLRGRDDVGRLAEAAARAQAKLKEYTDAQVKAGELLGEKTGDWTAWLTAQQNKLNEAVNKDMAGLEHAVASGSGGVASWTQKLAEAEKRAKSFGEELQKAQDKAAAAAGNWSQVLQDKLTKDANSLGNATAHAALQVEQYGFVANTTQDKIERITERQEARAMRQQQVDDLVVQANLKAARAAGDFAAIVSDESAIAATAMSRAVAAATVDVETYGAVTVDTTAKLASAATENERIALRDRAVQDAVATAQEKAALAAGDFVTALGIAQSKLQTETAKATSDLTEALMGNGSLGAAVDEMTTAITDNVKQSLVNRQAQDIVNQKTIQVERSLGDLAGAFVLTSQVAGQKTTDAFNALSEHFLTGDGDLQSLIQSYKDAKSAQDATTEAQKQALLASGQFSAALQSVANDLNQKASDAIAKVTLDFYNHHAASQADIQSAKEAVAAAKALADAQWEAAFATGDAATQTQMLNQAFSGLVQETNAQISDMQAMGNAERAVQNAEAAATVQAIQAMTVAVADQTAILQSEEALQKSVADASLKAYNDQTSILTTIGTNDQTIAQTNFQIMLDQINGDALKTSLDRQILEAQKQVGADQVALARAQAAADRADAVASIRIANDNLRIANLKAQSDASDQRWKGVLAMDAIQLAKDQVVLLRDQQRLEALQTVIQSAIHYDLSQSKEYEAALKGILSDIKNDNLKIAADEQKQADDQNAANADAARNALEMAQAQYQLEQDKQAQQNEQTFFQQYLAELQRQTAVDQQTLSATQQTASNTETLNQTMQKQLDAAKEALLLAQQDALRRRMGLDRSSVVGMGTTSYLTNFAASAYANKGMPS